MPLIARNFGVTIEITFQQASVAMHEISPTRRKHIRYHCGGGVELRRNESSPAVFANLSDISLEGCYVETVSTFPVGSELLFLLRIGETDVRGRADVKASNHAVGMGLSFQHLSPEDQQKLEFVVGTLAGKNELRPEDQRTVVPEDPIRKPAPLTTTRPVPTASMTSVTRPAAAATAAPPRTATQSPLAQKITAAINQLNELEQQMVRERMDPRLIAQFHDSLGHLRQTTWTIQQWVELNSNGGDPFEVLPQLEAERMQMLGKLAHNVNADIDAGSLNEFTLGISELYETIQATYRRLRKMLVGEAGE
ncbi:MAG TPA: PilZ domain-containing protein [Candidatus Angelobacter sp.]|nr:PilZ domain-containing protein [Candidatus Angelobacter sp.]